MKCLYCGSEYADVSLTNCPNCGKKFIQRSAIRSQEESEDEVDSTTSDELSRRRFNAGITKECPYCKKDISWEATICPACDSTLSPSAESESDDLPSVRRPFIQRPQSTSLIIGGILLLFVGIAGAIVGALAVLEAPLAESIGLASGYSGLGLTMVSIGGLGIFLSLGVVAGGYFAIRRSNFVLSIVGAEIALVIGIVSPFFIGSIIGFIATILIATSHNEFN